MDEDEEEGEEEVDGDGDGDDDGDNEEVSHLVFYCFNPFYENTMTVDLGMLRMIRKCYREWTRGRKRRKRRRRGREYSRLMSILRLNRRSLFFIVYCLFF